MLKGSMLHQKQKEFEIVYHDTAPYEVLTTHELPYADTLRLKYVEEMVETDIITADVSCIPLHIWCHYMKAPLHFLERCPSSG